MVCNSLALAVIALLAVPSAMGARMLLEDTARPPQAVEATAESLAASDGQWVCPPGLDSKLRVCDGSDPETMECTHWTVYCYVPCKAGYTRGGHFIFGGTFTCYSDCAPDFRDDGLYCAKPSPYGRGVGYAIWNEDKCERENPDTGCERCLAMYYPKCKAGFHPVGCNICSPDCPANQSDIGVSCKKDSYDTANMKAEWKPNN